MSEPIMPREDLGEKIARAIAPESWQEFDAGNGRCSNMAGWAIKDSIYAAGRVMDMLHEEGYPVPASKSKAEESAGRGE